MSKIEWTDKTWNPITGCTKVSGGCKNCYAEREFRRVYPGRAFGNVKVHEDRLAQPLGWRKPRRVFVCSMGDLFHESLSFETIDRVFAVMALTKRHIYQVLTKRPERMREYLDSRSKSIGFWQTQALTFGSTLQYEVSSEVAWELGLTEKTIGSCGFPLSNVHIGVSAENQGTYDDRVYHLIRTPGAVRFVSLEPLLAKIDTFPFTGKGTDNPGIDWVIVGGESGQNARPTHPDWVRYIRDQCVLGDTPFFFKQWGNWSPTHEWLKKHPSPLVLGNGRTLRGVLMRRNGEFCSSGDLPAMMAGTFDFSGWQHFVHVSKKKSGRTLDGVVWGQMP